MPIDRESKRELIKRQVKARRDEHDADGVDFAPAGCALPEAFAGEAVAQLVEDLGDDGGEVEGDEVVGLEDALAVFVEVGPSSGEVPAADTQRDEEQHDADGAEQPAYGGVPSVEQAVGVPDGDFGEEDVEHVPADLFADALAVAFEEAGRVGRDIAGEEVGDVELAEELDDFALGGGVVAEGFIDGEPGFFDGAFAIEQPDESIGRFVQAEELVGGRIAEDVPGATAIALSEALDEGADARPCRRDAVPAFVIGGSVDAHGFAPLPPEFHEQPVAGLACPDPRIVSGADLNAGDAFHAGR